MTPLVSQLWPQFMADPDFAACFGRVVVEHAQMLRQERQVIFTLRSSAPLDKGLCARLLASLAPDYEGFELRINNLFGYATLDEAGLRELMEEMKRDGVPINGFLDRCRITITGQNITIGVCHGTKFLQEMQFERLLAERIAAHTGVKPRVTLESSVGEAEQRQHHRDDRRTFGECRPIIDAVDPSLLVDSQPVRLGGAVVRHRHVITQELRKWLQAWDRNCSMYRCRTWC